MLIIQLDVRNCVDSCRKATVHDLKQEWDMRKKLGRIVILSHVLFYVGIGMMIYLYFVEDNSPLWLVSIIFMVTGIIGGVIPDSMINVGIEGISISSVRWTMILKYIVFMGLNLFLNRFFTLTSIVVEIIFVVDSFFAVKLAKETNATQIQMKDYKKMVDRFDTTKIERIFKFVAANIFFVLLFLSVHENIMEFVVMMVINIAVYFYTLEKILKNLENVGKKEIRICRMFLWILEAIIIFSVYCRLRMVTIGLLSTYYMVVTDITMERKTSLVKLGKTRKLLTKN